MIRKLASSFVRARLGAVHVTALLGLAGAAFLPAAHAVPSFDPATVVTGDTFGIEAVGYNTTTPSGNIFIIQPTLTPTFGTTQTYASGALGGQTLTVTSSESVSGYTTTDTITISVPSNFVPTGTTDNNGNVINAIEFSIGNYLGATNTLDFNTALVSPTATGTAFINSPTQSSVGLTQNPIFSNGNKSFSDAEAVQSGGTSISISTNDITSFTITLTSVPEPSTYATMALGAVALFWVIARRRASRA